MANYVTVLFITWCMLKLESGAELAINCTAARTCGQCIQKYGCIWCADPNRVSPDRCFDETSTNCSERFIMNPQSSSMNDPDLTSKAKKTIEEHKKGEKNAKNAVSSDSTSSTISPQFINIKLRPNNPLRIKMRYHHAPDYPLDIYYLMDSSKSLMEEKLVLSFGSLGTELKKKVSKLTRDLRLGFGSFVEKPVPPFIDYDPEKLLKPCQDCIPTYSFRNFLSLTSDTSLFSKTVMSLNLSSNRDNPESGLDGIMQSIVCQKKIGWRPKARRLLVYSSDAPFHIAGDGKLLGIVKPNDGCCHLDENGFYMESTNQDYPSIQHIRSEVENKTVNLIFTVPESQKLLYEKLANDTYGFVAVKKKNASHKETISIITNLYEKMAAEIEIQSSTLPEQLRIRYFSKCLNLSSPLNETQKCQGLKINDSIEFELDIELLKCPTNTAEWNQQFDIHTRRIDEKMTVNLKMLCDCECNENREMCEEHSSKCSEKGKLQFGVCQCDSGFSGADCSCAYREDDFSNCRANTDAAICSGRGSCECNKCHCDQKAKGAPFGQYCECSNSSCASNQGKLCSDHGVCICNKCKCNEGWTGEDCACESKKDGCRENSDEEICSGNGDCVCNKCVCNGAEKFSGQFCKKYETNEIRCGKFHDCVLCLTQQNGHCPDKCEGKTTNMVGSNEDLHQEELTCAVYDSKNCKYRFSFKFIGKEVEINVLEKPSCENGPPSILAFVIGLVAAIVLVGFLCLMAWKIFVVIQDRKEFEKFEKERGKATWEDVVNPLYRPPEKKYRNPLFEMTKQD